ncbi:MAG: hypothetical protein BWY95_00209 [Bacteroidetes bacterium ADurb.BinA104]|nr:MAG: hypothetical protein BWY95_00209 [Bacteroidetes bacterium ADurb.BinA104]
MKYGRGRMTMSKAVVSTQIYRWFRDDNDEWAQLGHNDKVDYGITVVREHVTNYTDRHVHVFSCNGLRHQFTWYINVPHPVSFGNRHTRALEYVSDPENATKARLAKRLTEKTAPKKPVSTKTYRTTLLEDAVYHIEIVREWDLDKIWEEPTLLGTWLDIKHKRGDRTVCIPLDGG